MRIGGFRIGFALVGSALLAASVTSIAIAADNGSHGPQCYGACPTKTRLTLSAKTVTFGSENTLVFTVVVKPKVRGTHGNPVGTAVVVYRSTTLCTAVLTDYGRHKAKGTCSPSADALAARHKLYRIRAVYNGTASFSGSHARRRTLRVVS